MSEHYTYEQIASDFNLWCEYADRDGVMTREEFDSLPVEDKVKLQVAAFGEESNSHEAE